MTTFDEGAKMQVDPLDPGKNDKVHVINDSRSAGAVTRGTDDIDEVEITEAETEADVTDADLEMLEYAAQNESAPDLMKASLDSADSDGVLLDEVSSLSRDTAGRALDVPGSEADDVMERTGSEDEENNYYSIGGDNHDALEEGRE
jgi:hypothetical protein